MATTLFNNNITKFIFRKINTSDELLLRIILFLTPNMIYTYSTKENRIITVKNKYLYTNNGYTKFMLIDSENNHYCVNNTLWFWKWNSIEDWNTIEINKPIKINYYGYRIPVFGIFPNIYHTESKINLYN